MKGNYQEECNITACQKPNSAVFYNHSTQKYYCSECALRLNSDPFNKRDAMEMFGHDLCTLELPRGITIHESMEQDKAISFIEYKDFNDEIKSGRENRRERRRGERKNKNK